jgi:FKBP-type peptidyl-prolyl cis-trans isomerase
MSKKYLIVTIFLGILMIILGIYAFSTKQKSNNQVFQTQTPSAKLDPSTEPTASASVTTNMNSVTELKIEDIKEGTGDMAVSGKRVTVNYAGTLTDGTKFDSSYDRNEPFSFNLGMGEVIQGWDQGISGMKVGGKRKLTIPSNLAYGDNGIPGAIPGGATLIFEVELLKVE